MEWMDNIISGIYEIRNIINNKIYIGSTKNLKRREADHFRSLCDNIHRNKYLQRSFNKYGKENFEFKILLICDSITRVFYEQIYIDKLKPEYNIYRVANSP